MAGRDCSFQFTEVPMRLTLRTLLAYMDDILDPADHEELGKKIEASDFAAELIHRSRDTVRRLRLGAPEVLAGEDDDVLNPDPASDANSVAEYLDNTLPPEQVAEFERVCLESGTVADMHLAEVTSCHHVLTMVLGEPAEIEPNARRRMYELPERIEAGEKLRIESAHPPVGSAATVANAVPAVAPVVTQTVVSAATPIVQPAPAAAPSVLPDYLRVASDRRRRGRRLATLAVLFVIGCGAAYLISGAFEEAKVPDDVVAGVDEDILSGDLAIENVQIGDAPVEDAAPADTVETTAPPFVPEDAATPEDAAADNTTASAFDDAAPAEDAATDTTSESAVIAETTEPAIPPTATTDTPLESPTAETPVVEPTDVAAPGDVAAAAAGTTADTPTPQPNVPLPPQDPIVDPDAAIESATSGTADDDPLDLEAGESEDAEGPPAPVGPVQLGVYVGNNDVLLRYVPETEQWLRLPPRTSVTAGNTLLSLPKYRTHVVLKTVNAYLSGGTQITVPEQDMADDAQLSLEMAYGRLLLNAGLKGSQIALKIGDTERELHLDNSASLAIEARRVFVPGTDYEMQSAPVQIDWYLTSGSLEWQGADGTKEIIKAPAAWKSVNNEDEAAETVTELPTWIDREPMSELERRARDRFAEDLPVGQPVGLRLQELNEEQGAGREIRTLSAEASLYVGEFEPFIQSLNDSDQRIAWRSHIDAMRQAIAMDPKTATKLHKEFVTVRGKEAGEDLYSMVRGFTPEQIGMTREELKQGVVVNLLRWLESESLDYRVLAIYNLDEIKGTTNLKDYRPDGIPRTRNIAVTKIREMIEDNEFLDLP
jgi:hypothetical protein